MDPIELTLNQLMTKVNELTSLLKVYEKQIDDLCPISLNNMGISEKVRVAKVILMIKKL